MSAPGAGERGPGPTPATPRKRKRGENKTLRGTVTVAPPQPSPTPSSTSSASESESCAASARDLVAESIEKLSTGDYKTVPKVLKNPKEASVVWNSFHVVVDKSDLEVGTAQCLACTAVLVYNAKTGPSSLKKHHDHFCRAELSPASQAEYRPVPNALREVFVNKVADTCALTMGAVDMLTGEAVVDLLQTVVDIATRC
ncbi:Large envelope protein [Frankliniella fusca]|uniref:Large envelope protein n=1 Tax=Frankliniella fusca TaxID=407009 RepID=A0AAE1I0E2_9NEOP|nr:Large envelope protein [Frankliniella fusca]